MIGVRLITPHRPLSFAEEQEGGRLKLSSLLQLLFPKLVLFITSLQREKMLSV
jgi:hypothetical protein